MRALITRSAGIGLEYKWQAALIVTLGLFLSVLDSTIVSVALSAMRQEFRTDFDTITWVVTAYFLAQAAVIPVTGYLSDRTGTRLIFVVAMGIFVLGSALCAFAPSTEALIAARVIQGIGGGALWPTSFAIAYRAFPRDEWGRATALIGVPVLLAPVLGPVVGGYLTTTFSWRAIFAINLPLGVAACILAAVILRGRAEDEPAGEEPASPAQAFDVLGFVLTMVGFTAVVYGLTQAGVYGWSDASADRALAGGAIALVVLVIVELLAPNPVLDIRLLLNPTFARASAVLWVVVGVFYGSLFLIPYFLEKVEGLSPLTAGEILITQGVGAAVGIALSGELYNKLGPRRLVTAGAGALALSMIGFAHLALDTTGLSLQGWLLLRGLGLGLTTQPLQNLALSVVSHRNLTRASSLVNVTRQVFTAAGVAGLAALVSQRAEGHGASLSASLHAHAPTGAATACLVSGRAGLAACLQRHAIVLGVNDGFSLALVVCSLLVVLAFFVGRDPSLQALKATRRLGKRPGGR
jgi:EmrB/QacA subfamily drug resistance transporter